MLLENEITHLFSRLFTGIDSDLHRRDAQTGRTARSEHSVPLMQIVENKVSQRHTVTGARKLAVAARIALASEVGPPPLTPTSFSR